MCRTPGDSTGNGREGPGIADTGAKIRGLPDIRRSVGLPKQRTGPADRYRAAASVPAAEPKRCHPGIDALPYRV